MPDPRRNHEQELIELLQQLRAVPPRQPADAARGRARFIAQIEAEQGAGSRPGVTLIQQFKEYIEMSSPTFRRALNAGMVAILVLALMAGGTGLSTVTANALPGDALYGVKTGYEQARVSLTRAAYDRATLNIGYAGVRLEEIARLIGEGRTDELAIATGEYEAYIDRALEALARVTEQDPVAGRELTARIANSLRAYAKTLSDFSAALPAAERMAIEDAISHSAASGTYAGEFEFKGVVESVQTDHWVVSGHKFLLPAGFALQGAVRVGDRVEIEATANEDGSFTLREYEIIDARPEPTNSLTPRDDTDDDDDMDDDRDDDSDDDMNDDMDDNSDDDMDDDMDDDSDDDIDDDMDDDGADDWDDDDDANDWDDDGADDWDDDDDDDDEDDGDDD